MWAGPEAYERLMGRWSRQVASSLVEFACVEDGARILDVGCGTGSLVTALLEQQKRLDVFGVDSAKPYIDYTRRKIRDPQLTLEEADAQSLPFPDDSFDRCLSLLVLNFIPDARRAVEEMYRVTRPGGIVVAAVWDYGDGMEMLRILWDTAIELDPGAEPKHERNMPYCRQGELADLWTETGLQQVKEIPLHSTLRFTSFDDYWEPFLTGVGPSGSYVSSLPKQRQKELRDLVHDRLASGHDDQRFALQVRAWAVRGTVPTN